ncbi:MAG: chitobiase/beta-hexosaminidase C-terminal domain-containing protein, partial [Spirochaetes bacterium]|nr:chitobiase/beta-hexosaminidase C-terminal domain-containing protein [Spirochaetota bacterium]
MKKIINTIFLLTVIIYLFFFASCREVIPKVSAPIFTPEGGTFNDYLYVTIYCPTTDATIRYTLDGSPPSPSYGIIYNQPIEITTTTTIRAIAYRDLMKSSEVVSATFTILKVAPISISPKGATYNSTQTITISCPTPGATIKYTMDGTDPSPTYGNVYTLPLQIGSDTNLKVIAYKEGMTPSNIVQEIYYFTKVATPSFSLSGGTYNDYITLEINCVTEGATIKYTTDGSDPSETNGTTYSNPIQITSSTQIKAIAFKSGLDNSEITSAFYILKASDPSFSPTGGTYNNSQTVSISCATPSATIKYTIDGSDPINGQTYTGPIDVLVNTTIKAIAIKSGLNNSNVITSVYNISKVATPIINPQGGTYSEPVTVSISCPTPGATIRYTTDGSNPSQSNGTVYSTPININSTTTIKAIAYKSGMNDSSIASETFTINLNQVAPPIISPNGGTYINSQTVTITTNTSGATIRYTTDGTIPSSSYGNIYSGPINLTTNTTINAIAYKGGMTDSQVTSAIFNIKVAAPTFSLASGTYNGTQSVNINCSTSGATIRYTTDGSNPTPTYGFLYTGAINISTNTTLKAIAYKSNMTDSDITTSTYYIKVATPTFSPSPGTYISQQSITISCSTSGATIKYTTDGTDPSPTNGNTYSGAITITASTTLKAMAYKANMVNSDVNGGNYVIKVANPTFSPSPGTYTSGQSVTINCSTSGATIRYTLDGSTPTSTSGTIYSGPITVSNCKVIKAIAYKSGLADSDVTTANYVINPFSGLRLIKDNINKNQSTEDVHISGNYAYLAAATYGLIIVNISSPSNPSI